ncbi:methyltransferase domain-containing protein [Streptomyces sp. WMMC500]|uniref:methyltransferase domain-containing protein n=1 Tax=Streptomyces sp. WMMC500 TaxID=3015154 RepID=UPI00248BCA8B|nr:methyltransferase domain-containing protein [Streptomyces sp. WMMC500]WBB64003.1 methyltransferase domain-containing protein [Streptomyces sp. WMMC500]
MSPDSTEALRHEFAAALGDGGSSPWRAAFAAVPRHVFVPEFYRQDEGGGGWRRVTRSDRGYLETVYSDTALMTQLDAHGVPTSSSSEPGLMLTMLDALDARPGATVFELGTGTGYNAALLAHRLGAENVTSVDVDPDLVALAARRLAESGTRPFVATADGALGYPPRAPYSRFIATAALRSVPRALMEQAVDGAVIVAPIGFGVIRAEVTGPGHAEGRFLPTPALFMPRRLPPGAGPDVSGARNRPPEPTSLAVTAVLAGRWAFPLSLALPGYNAVAWRAADGAVSGMVLWTEDGSTAVAELAGRVRQAGPRRLWDTVEEIASLFPGGEPAREDYGITVTPHTQRFWYGTPEGASWPLPPG